MKFVIAEFDKLPLYFPLYLGVRKSFFQNYGLSDIKFINTHSDLYNYLNLVSHRASVGLADPIFSIAKDKIPKGEIVAVLVKKMPVVVAGLPGKSIKNIKDLVNYRIATFPKFTTCNTIARFLLGDKIQLIEIPHKKIIKSLINREVDFAFILPEQLVPPLVQVFSLSHLFPHYLFTGLVQVQFSNNIEQLTVLKLGLRDTLKYLRSNKEESFKLFCNEFPGLQNAREIFNTYFVCWSEDGILKLEEWNNAFKVWDNVYKNIFKKQDKNVLLPKPEEKIINTLTTKKYCRDYPYNIPRIIDLIKKALSKKQKINLIGFWGASNKTTFGDSERKLIEQLLKLRKELKPYCNGFSITFLLSDMHAILNGYDAKKVNLYLSLVKKELSKKNIDTLFLSDLWKKWGITKDKIVKTANKTEILSNHIYKRLVQQSQKHFSAGDKTEGVKIYYAMRKIENSFIEVKFMNSILFSYTDSKSSEFLPDLPTLFFYTTKRDENNLPWFQKE